MEVSRLKEWAKASAIVVAGALAGGVIGNGAGSFVIGALFGGLGGMAINSKRNCPVCSEHQSRIQSILRENQ